MPLPKRFLTSMMCRYNGSNILVDCGEATQIAIKEKGWTVKPIDVICFTHYHADHISGLPGLLLAMKNAERTEPITMIGPKGLERVVNALRVIAPEIPFEIKFIEIKEDNETFEINGYRINAFKVKHKVLCYGYSIEIDRAGKFDLEKAKELDLPVTSCYFKSLLVCHVSLLFCLVLHAWLSLFFSALTLHLPDPNTSSQIH